MGNLQDVVLSYNGSQIATSCKDKKMRLHDPRVAAPTGEVQPHDGSKCFKLAYLGPDGNIVSVGFTRQSKRQFRIWDPKKMDKQIATIEIDQAAGVIMPFYDED